MALSGSSVTTTCSASCGAAAGVLRRDRTGRGRRLARFLPAWRGRLSASGVDAVAEAVAQMQGAAIAASVIERDVLAARVNSYRSATSTSCVRVARSCGSVLVLSATDGRIRLVYRDQIGLLIPDIGDPSDDPTHGVIRRHLRERGASFWRSRCGSAGRPALRHRCRPHRAVGPGLGWRGHE